MRGPHGPQSPPSPLRRAVGPTEPTGPTGPQRRGATTTKHESEPWPFSPRQVPSLCVGWPHAWMWKLTKQLCPSSALRSQPRAGETAVVCTGAAALSWGATGLRTSPDWFSLSFWLKLSCLKSIPASLLRVPFPVRKGGDAACGCVDLPPDVHLGPQREAVPVGCLPYCAAELCSPLQRRAPLGKALSLLGRVRVVPFQKVSL